MSHLYDIDRHTFYTLIATDLNKNEERNQSFIILHEKHHCTKDKVKIYLREHCIYFERYAWQTVAP